MRSASGSVVPEGGHGGRGGFLRRLPSARGVGVDGRALLLPRLTAGRHRAGNLILIKRANEAREDLQIR